jgi:Mrp family chromosome partitioning ATPase
MLAPDSANLLSSSRLEERMTELRKEYSYIIVDAPPLNRYSDALLFSQHADGLVLVLEAGVTRREAAANVVANLRSVGIPILGAVLNKRVFPIPKGLYQRL